MAAAVAAAAAFFPPASVPPRGPACASRRHCPPALAARAQRGPVGSACLQDARRSRGGSWVQYHVPATLTQAIQPVFSIYSICTTPPPYLAMRVTPPAMRAVPLLALLLAACAGAARDLQGSR